MKISKAAALAFFAALNFTKASEWDDEKLLEKTTMIPKNVSVKDVPPEHVAFYQKLEKAVENKNELTFGDSEDAAPAKEKPAKTDGPIDVTDLDMAALRSIVEEREFKVSAAARKNVEVLRLEVKKLLKQAPKRSKTDKAVDKAAKASEKGKAAATDKDDSDKPAPKKAAKAKKEDEDEGAEKDQYGCRVGSMRSKVYAAMGKDFKSDEEIAKEAGCELRQARSYLRNAARAELGIERVSVVQYRFKK